MLGIQSSVPTLGLWHKLQLQFVNVNAHSLVPICAAQKKRSDRDSARGVVGDAKA